MCQNECCDLFPQYGVAPHECYWRKPGGFEKNALGTSTVLPADTWPDNFLLEVEDGKPELSWGACGVFYCPECKEGMEETATLWGRQRVLEYIQSKEGSNGR